LRSSAEKCQTTLASLTGWAEPGLPTATVLEHDIEMLAIEPKQVNRRQHILSRAISFGPSPALADAMTEAQPAAIAHRDNRLGE